MCAHRWRSSPHATRLRVASSRVFETSFPILSTPDLPRAIAFYRDLLDGEITFQFPPEGEPGYVAIHIGPSEIGIAHDPDVAAGAEHQRFALWVYADDCDAAVARLRDAGVTIVDPPADQPWGERVARVHDPDGNVVVIGSRPD
jgi:lactoylglutathione lyase